MRFILTLLMMTFLMPVVAQAQVPPPLSPAEEALLKKDLLGVLRGFIWGLPPTVILEYEQGVFMGEENGALLYFDYIKGLKSTIAYEFSDNKLWRARLFIEKKYVDPQDRIRDLLTIRSDLTQRYGEPVSEEFKWTKNTDKNWPESWGWAVYRSELFITITWQNKETEVTAYLGSPDPYDPQLSVTYVSRETNNAVKRDQQLDLLKAP